MSTKQNQKDKMASWRKDLPDLPELREEEPQGATNIFLPEKKFSQAG